MKVSCLFIALFIFISFSIHSQTVFKLSGDCSFSLHFSDRSITSYPLMLYVPDLYTKPVLVRGSVFNSMSAPSWYNFTVYGGVEFNNKWLLEFGYTQDQWVFTNAYVQYITQGGPLTPVSTEPPFNNNYGGSGSNAVFYGFGSRKIGLYGTYQFKNVLKNDKFKIQPTATLGFAFFGFRKPANTYFHFEGMGSDMLYTGEVIEMRYYTTIFGKGKSYYGAQLRFGLGLKFSNSKRELFRIYARYEQGLKAVFMVTTNIKVGNDYIFNSTPTISRGSNMQFGVQFPMFSYNFTKKKFYRD